LNSKRVLQDCPTPFDYDDPGTLRDCWKINYPSVVLGEIE
jgi:hypothetical protein